MQKLCCSNTLGKFGRDWGIRIIIAVGQSLPGDLRRLNLLVCSFEPV
jgi:hypothetical protein